jgi:hypothetical protein
VISGESPGHFQAKNFGLIRTEESFEIYEIFGVNSKALGVLKSARSIFSEFESR